MNRSSTPSNQQAMHHQRRLIMKSGAGLMFSWAAPNAIRNAHSSSREFSFALIGDVPYSALDIERTQAVLATIDPSCLFVIHVGDLKASADPCTDAFLDRRFELLRSSQLPLVFVPGDNDWSDCAKPNSGAMRPFERLDYLRNRLFNEPRSLGVKTLEFEQQIKSSPDFPVPENLRWIKDGALFVSLNRPGGVDLRKFTNTESEMLSELYRANERWLRTAFELATKRGIKLLAIAAHANPGFENDQHSWRVRSKRDRHAPFRRLLGDLTRQFDGHVLFMHGDTHWFQVNQPLIDRYGNEVANFTRIECFGTPFSSSWVHIRVTPDSAPMYTISTRHLDIPRRP